MTRGGESRSTAAVAEQMGEAIDEELGDRGVALIEGDGTAAAERALSRLKAGDDLGNGLVVARREDVRDAIIAELKLCHDYLAPIGDTMKEPGLSADELKRRGEFAAAAEFIAYRVEQHGGSRFTLKPPPSMEYCGKAIVEAYAEGFGLAIHHVLDCMGFKRQPQPVEVAPGCDAADLIVTAPPRHGNGG